MDDKFPWIVLGGSILLVIVITTFLHHTFANPRAMYPLATFTFILSMSTSIFCIMLVPIDLYVTADGASAAIKGSAISAVLSQSSIQTAYLSVFGTLLFNIGVLVPFTYFYGEDHVNKGDIDDDTDTFERIWHALRSTMYFIIFLFLLLIASLAIKRQPARGHEVEWVLQALDADHSGLRMVSFAIACMTLVGICLWAIYTAYGLVALPFDLLMGSQSVAQERKQIEEDLQMLRGKHRRLEMRTNKSRSEAQEIETLKGQENRLHALHYRLQELEDQAMSWFSKMLLIFVPFRWLMGAIAFAMSTVIGVSVFVTMLERTLHSPCGSRCAFSLPNHAWWDPAGAGFVQASKIFPLDFVLLGGVVAYIFAASFFGLTSLGIRCLCIDICSFPVQKTSPQALLVLCGIMAHILLAASMTLVTFAPDYTTFGSQVQSDGTACSTKNSKECRASVISSFFSRIIRDIPFFSLFYFLATWAFLLVFFGVSIFFVTAANPRRIPLKDDLSADEEQIGLLMDVF
eukprot:GEMP01009104.1.p1 GENE.GEMP01009104.1~~GEMP01009104.1.p1  ORF type:complete len:523 (+),score=75.99 GEMP01009104.1:24-1571(+)